MKAPYIDILRQSEQIIEESGIGDCYRAAAFSVILGHLLRSADESSMRIEPSGISREQFEATVPYIKLAELLKISIRQARGMFALEGSCAMLKDEIAFPAQSKRECTCILALLIAAANEVLPREQWGTSYKEVRSAADHHGCLDKNNFAKAFSDIADGIDTLGETSGKRFKLNKRGIAFAQKRVKSIIDSSPELLALAGGGEIGADAAARGEQLE